MEARSLELKASLVYMRPKIKTRTINVYRVPDFKVVRLVLLPNWPPLSDKGSSIGISPLEHKWVQLCLIFSKVGYSYCSFSMLARWDDNNTELIKLRKKEAFIYPF